MIVKPFVVTNKARVIVGELYRLFDFEGNYVFNFEQHAELGGQQ